MNVPGAPPKVVLVTGASAGMGQKAAEHLHAHGFRVYGASRSITERTLPFSTLPLDLDDAKSIEACLRTILEREGRIDALVNCAGFAVSGSVEDTTLEEARKQLETNFFGTAAICRAVLPILRKQGGGFIVNMSSIAGAIPMPFQAYYSASKAALSAFTRALRMEVAAFGIHVTAIEPGDHKTEFTERRRVAVGARTGAYEEVFGRALTIMESDEKNGSLPEPVGPLVLRILTSSSPRPSYFIGPWFQRFAVWLRQQLPERLFDWGLMKYYKIK